MAILTSNQPNVDVAITIESGKGTLVFNTGESNERKVDIAQLDLPLQLPAGQNISVEGSSILFYNTGASITALAPFSGFRHSEGTLVTTQPIVNFAEGGGTLTVYGGEGKVAFDYVNGDNETQSTVIQLNRIQYPFHISIPSGLPGTQTARLEVLGGSFLLTS